MEHSGEQAELFGFVWQPVQHPFRLRVNDIFRFEGRICRVIRVGESAAVVLMNRPVRQFTTRFDKPVRFQPAPALFRISVNSEVEILNRVIRDRKSTNNADPPFGGHAT
jgi:hypothetical protein